MENTYRVIARINKQRTRNNILNMKPITRVICREALTRIRTEELPSCAIESDQLTIEYRVKREVTGDTCRAIKRSIRFHASQRRLTNAQGKSMIVSTLCGL